MIDKIEISNEIVILYLDTITLQVEKLSEVEDCRAQNYLDTPDILAAGHPRMGPTNMGLKLPHFTEAQNLISAHNTHAHCAEHFPLATSTMRA